MGRFRAPRAAYLIRRRFRRKYFSSFLKTDFRATLTNTRSGRRASNLVTALVSEALSDRFPASGIRPPCLQAEKPTPIGQWEIYTHARLNALTASISTGMGGIFQHGCAALDLRHLGGVWPGLICEGLHSPVCVGPAAADSCAVDPPTHR